MYRILIVEDDEVIGDALERHLSGWGFSVKRIGDFRAVMEEFTRWDPQLVLMDISLPFYNGYHWCAEIRKRSKVPVIFISSAGDNMNVVMAVNMGGDDFIAKPFDLAVLTAKVQAMLRRTYDFREQLNVMEHRGAILNLNDATLTCGPERVELTKNEFRILQLLIENKGRVVERDLIMNRLWQSDSFIDDNTLTVNVARLRKKLADAGLSEFITTKKGMGYIVE